MEAASAVRGLERQRAIRPQGGRKVRRKMRRHDCFGDSIVSPDEAAPEKELGRGGRSMKHRLAQTQVWRGDVCRSAGILPAIIGAAESVRSRQDAGATQTPCESAFHVNWDAVFSARNCAPRRPLRFPHESRKSNAPGDDAQCGETGRRRRPKPPWPPLRSPRTADGCPQ